MQEKKGGLGVEKSEADGEPLKLDYD